MAEIILAGEDVQIASRAFHGKATPTSVVTVGANTDFDITVGVNQGIIDQVHVIPAAGVTYTLQVFEHSNRTAADMLYEWTGATTRIDDLIGLHFKDELAAGKLYCRIIAQTGSVQFTVKAKGRETL
jgi:hypothetical protein